MDRKTAAEVFARYRSGSCTEAERQLVEGWILHGADSPLDLTDAELQEDLAEIRSILERGSEESRPRAFRIRKWLPYAAAIIIGALVLGIVNWDRGGRDSVQEIAQTEIPPGGNRAILTLADGQTVDLNRTQTGIIVGDEIKYADGSAVLSPGAERPKNQEDTQQYAILTTPKGGIYNIVLPDGTKVWLNSASSLKYPVRFSGDERVVKLEGEAYFEVTSLGQPFLVETNDQTVQVLGTKFNISAYNDEQTVKTTLLEGSVRVILPAASASTLKPGQQSVVHGSEIAVQDVEAAQYIAWKDGNFYFNNTPLAEMMKQIARWYDVDIVYESSVPRELFSGSMSRNISLQTVLKLLEVSEIEYRIEDRMLIIE